VKRLASTLLTALLALTAITALPALQACTSLGLQQPKSFDQSYAYALAQTTAVRDAARIALEARQISIADAEYALRVTDQSRTYLDTARQLFQAGDSLRGKAQLELATAIGCRRWSAP
jgi:hypothetical protein